VSSTGPDDRDRLVGVLVDAIGAVDWSADVALRGIRTWLDYRAAAPLLDRERHASLIENQLGFGVRPGPANELDGGGRAATVERWRAHLRELDVSVPERIVRLGRHWASRVDAVIEEDLHVLAPDAELTTVTDCASAKAVLDTLRTARPELVVVPSLSVVDWLERAARVPLERAVPSLRVLMAEHDLDASVRSRVPIVHAGRFDRAGRIGLPAARGAPRAWTLAIDGCLIELLAEGDPDTISRGRTKIVAPERASLGRRYELVLSAPSGYLRVRTGIDVRVVGFETRASRGLPRVAPRVVDIPPPPGDLPLDGVTLPGSWVTAAVRQAFRPEDPALVDARVVALDPPLEPGPGRADRSDAFDGTELAGLAHAERSGRGLPGSRGFVAHVEVQGAADPRLAEGLARRIDDALRRRSGAYEFLREREDLKLPAVRIRPSGSAQARRTERIRRLHGRVEQPPVRVGPADVD
jgi:hypothetical protein